MCDLDHVGRLDFGPFADADQPPGNSAAGVLVLVVSHHRPTREQLTAVRNLVVGLSHSQPYGPAGHEAAGGWPVSEMIDVK
jgi:hypothetical protein